MEQPHGDSDLQPQDLSSTRSLPAAIDLTRKGEDCLVKVNSMKDLQVVKPPSWYPGSGSSKGLSFPETEPNHRLQPGDQIQPNDAFSNTTVTLSYVSRSHIFSTHDSLSHHSSLYGVPSISKFSTMDGYLQQMDRPLSLAPQSEMFDSMPPAQVMAENVAGVCLMQQCHEINSSRVASNGRVEKYNPHQRASSMEHSLSQDADNAGLQNGRSSSSSSSSWSHSAICIDSSPEPLITDMEEEGQRADSEVLFLISSRTEEPVLIQDSMSPRDLCSHSREYISPLEDTVSPSATSLDDVENVFILPQASCSPSFENDGDNASMLDTSKDYQQPGHKPKADSEPIVDLTEDKSTLAEVLENKPKETTASHLNGNAKAEQRTFERKQLPPRFGRGTRLEAIVMNINPNWYKVSTKKPKASKTQTQPPTNPQTQSSPSKADVSPNKQTSSVGKKKVQNKAASSSEGETKVKAAATKGRMDSINRNTDSCKESTSDPEHTCFSKYPHNHSTSPKTSSPPFAPVKDSEKESAHRESDPEPSEVDVLTVSPPLKTSPKSPGKHKAKTACREASFPTAKTAKATPAPKKKRKKPRLGKFSSIFSPQEPEIKLKYVNYKEEKRDMRRDTFSPFIHMGLKPSSTSPANCTVINYPEEEKPRQKKGQGQQQAGGSGSGGFIPGAVPSTSCLQLGRISTHSQYHSSLVCCLCRGSANAMDLGDLHGPYYPEGYRPSAKPPARTPGLKEEEDFSDSDSSCSIRGRGRKCARPPGVPWPHKPGPRLNQDGLLGRWTSDSDPSGSPAAKRARIENGAGVTSEAAVEDWYSPPVVPLVQCEYWLHEDCSIWSAGVFLVKGRIYGLEEAVKVGQETTCSRCHNPGATLGCFFKGCLNKYHYRCSLQSDCVLNEENFSMKCTKHKNKSFKGPPGNRRDDR
ncbi:retinoic acid-induced protein 1 isoform X1 [Salvelinus fontinalis]|uniref:retinoic acid-induced protein 1 isoform X1 n=1 Tax=Salvelinus fontinalis TaxID=8038 RepID=UPI0024850FCA|nr:retinoic acid-induced protein 1 isoform X1 [Salvelinus fontinalis]XP_055746382.1 retinoic acid-induced protein 1 isoform X1 [Salvelinus fontinalis]XP_055746383.1 retinoic acid-induced protein 1 isoform X1 [Salvelinus fontinalis]XP_055746384.1 retinoic acid-induced protein 1 isoform X1 [Salvelinus fontinalis]